LIAIVAKIYVFFKNNEDATQFLLYFYLFFLIRLIALNRLIEFESINRLESWQFELIRLESLGESIPKVGIETRIRFELISRVGIKTRFEKSIRIVKTISLNIL